MATQSPILTITRPDGMTIAFPGTYKGIKFPAPSRDGFEFQIQTGVNGGRNANATFVGEKVGRDNYKINNLKWTALTGDQVKYILQLFDDFVAYATFAPPDSNVKKTIKMYRGDVTAKPLFYKTNGTVELYESLAVNIIDCGEV